MNFDELGPPAEVQPLNSDSTNYQQPQIKIKVILLGITIVTVLVIILIMGTVWTYSREQPQKPMPINEFKISTKSSTSITSSTTLPKIKLESSRSEICAATRWNPVGKKLVKIEHASSIAVDNDFNVYVANWDTHTLQKWFSDTNELINLFEEQFPETPIFYHSLTRSLYFFYVYKDIPGVFKLVNGNSAPVNVFSSNGRGWNLDQLDSSCKGLYVNAAGDIFVLDQGRHRIVKWVVNATSGVLVAGRKEDESNSDQLEFPSGMYVDEINNSVYVITDMMGRRIKRFSNGSVYGVTVFWWWSEWTSDIKYNGIILGESSGGGATHFYTPQLMTFDKLGNLYVYDKSDGQVIRFDVNSTSCINNLH
ncbi:unnamed protein product [Adineta steineri]|uniref:Uncharacterized protein n=1 Tax=Adineta steineri TaxID=433720 RepID=A0A815NK94_9BILA|nr:unnamed protein product [Adineta steineri]CAF1440876.1 unnamed protein product [Adineta steineri]